MNKAVGLAGPGLFPNTIDVKIDLPDWIAEIVRSDANKAQELENFIANIIQAAKNAWDQQHQ